VHRRLCSPIERLFLYGLTLKMLVGLGSHMVIRLQIGHLAAVSTFEIALLLKTRKVSGTQAFVFVCLFGCAMKY
jgi:hypothetical protein